MTDLILHSYDGSPFTQRVLKMLAIKRARWRWVETPMMLPKDDLVALTGDFVDGKVEVRFVRYRAQVKERVEVG